MTDNLTLIKADLVLPDTILQDGYLYVQNDRIIAIADAPRSDLNPAVTIDKSGHYALPGLLDLQVNGGGGVLFNDAKTIDDLRTIIDAHKTYGTTGILATLLTDDPDTLVTQLRFIATAIRDDTYIAKHLLGIHLEGPFFNPQRRGTHPEQYLLQPSLDWIKQWVAAAAGALKIVTLAPELPGACDVIAYLHQQNIRVSLGHSNGTYNDVAAAVAAGATLGTHLFNAMSQIEGRAPNMVGGLLDHDVLHVGMINDGHHVHDASLRMALRAKGLERAFFVSDSMHILGAAIAAITYRGVTMTAKDGACYNDQGVFAGSAAPLLTALQRGVSHLGLNLKDAIRLCTANPARILGLTNRGQLAVESPADLILLNKSLDLRGY
jgi:N-acetylglucosamine-6-phosphate deacetylase